MRLKKRVTKLEKDISNLETVVLKLLEQYISGSDTQTECLKEILSNKKYIAAIMEGDNARLRNTLAILKVPV